MSRQYPKRVPVEVTPFHIKHARAQSCTCCLAALAIRDAIPCVGYVHCELNFVSLNRKGNTHREQGRLPSEMNKALILLDEGKRDEIEPFKFWLTLTPTSKIQRPTPERQKRVQELREKRRAEGKDKHHRKPIKRVSGVAVANLVEERTGIAPSRSATKRENVETLSQFEKWDIVRKATATA